MQVLPKGVHWIPGYLDTQAQNRVVEDIRTVVTQAPLFVPRMPRSGKPMSVRMTNCGTLGWVTDQHQGYRYQATHPQTGTPWPDIPASVSKIWEDLSGCSYPAEACLVNFYEPSAKMGLHQDRDEEEFSSPVISLSLGDTCLFRVGGTNRSDKTTSFKLKSGDAVILSGESRLCFHGVDRIYPETSSLLNKGGRINLTLRRVTDSLLITVF